jgi:hypothetical protein
LLREYCQREKRPLPHYVSKPPTKEELKSFQSAGGADGGKTRFGVLLSDPKQNSKNDAFFCPNAAFSSDRVAKDFAALLALFEYQRSLPLENKLPVPFRCAS